MVFLTNEITGFYFDGVMNVKKVICDDTETNMVSFPNLVKTEKVVHDIKEFEYGTYENIITQLTFNSTATKLYYIVSNSYSYTDTHELHNKRSTTYLVDEDYYYSFTLDLKGH